MEQFKDTLGIKEGDMAKAKQVWEMLDEMAAKDPAKYKKFIEQQKEEHEKMQKTHAPPKKVFGVKTREVFIL